MPNIKNLLLDRDGTLIKDKHYLADPAGVELLPGVAQTLGELSNRGLRFFLVSNQSGIGRGMFSSDAVRAVNERLSDLLRPYGVAFADILFCPHAPEDACNCRKPSAGLWVELVKRHALKAEESLMVGDKEDDVLFAANAGLAFRALVLTGKGENTARKLDLPLPDRQCMQLGNTSVQFVDEPESPSHPHLLLSSFSALESGLALIALRRDG